MRCAIAFVVALAWAFAAAAAPSIDASAVANLVYQLDCVSGRISNCGNRVGYAALWQVRFKIDVARDEDVRAWSTLKASLPTSEGGASASTNPSLLRIASFEARDLADYLDRIRSYLDATDFEVARRSVARACNRNIG